MEDIAEYLTGKKLYGDDFGLDEIKKWYDYQSEYYNEKDNEYNYSDRASYSYFYHQVNIVHGYKYLPKDKVFTNILGFGSAYGDELKPVLPQVKHITILEISDNFVNTEIEGKPVRYIKPQVDGTLPFDDNSFDLIVCIGVLHHIPNVTKIINEIQRVLQKDGYAIIREPINSMGDWRFSRPGLTSNERGIPLKIFRNIIKNTKLEIIKERLWCFKFTTMMQKFFKKSLFNNKVAVYIDFVMSWSFQWNVNYHPKNKFRTIRPVAVFYLLRK